MKGIVDGGRENIGVDPPRVVSKRFKNFDFSNVLSRHVKPKGHHPGSVSRGFRNIPLFLRTKETAGCLSSGNDV